MKIDIITLFPKMFDAIFNQSIIKRAKEKGLVTIETHDLRKWSKGKYKQVDDKPFGGGAGMVLMIEPIANAINELRTQDSIVIATTAKGNIFKQSVAKKLSENKHLIILAGHYEGFDQRILDHLTDFNISIGNFVLTGGEIPAMAIIDATLRLIPGVLGNEKSPQNDSFYKDDKTKQYPVYTRPKEFKYKNKILKVPDVLLSGDPKKITIWQKNIKQSN